MDNQRGLVQRIERKLETSVGDAFARVFGGAVLPEEVAAALRREAADGVRALEGNRLLAPNDYVITLGSQDYRQIGGDPDITTDTFAKHLAAYIGEQGWQTYGDVVVRFQQSSNLHTGQVRARGAVNPDVGPRPPASDPASPESDRAVNAEPGVSPMSDNPSYPGGQGQGRPGDDYYEERYGRHQEDARGGQEPRGPYPPEPGGYPAPRRVEPDQGGYPDQRPPSGYPPHYEQRPPAGYGGAPGYEQGYPPAPSGYGPAAGAPPGGGAPGYGQPGGQQYGGDYGRPPTRHDDYSRYDNPPEQPRPPYPEQGGYDRGAPRYGQQDYSQPGYGQPDYSQPDYGQPDYGQPDYSRYSEAPAAPSGYDYGHPPAGSGYEAPAPTGYGEATGGPGGYDYGQPAPPAGYDSYAQSGYSPTSITLQLDDGSGRAYQLHEGSNVVGRGQDAEFRLPDTGVSRRHLEIRWDGRVALLSDLNSTNGTTVNNAPVQEWQLADGDVIRLGHSEIIVRVH